MREVKNRPAHWTRLALATLISAAISHQATAQDSAPRLEEMIVTAQKRVENLQEVPISVAAVDGSKIDKSGVETLEDLTVLMPNIHFTETGFSTQVRVRGIGSDNSQGFEQSVAMYIDGIHHGRAQLFRAPMMDMQRAELLRGPQSTLFGKNSIAGALNLTTARPTSDFEGRVSVSHEFEHNQDEINLMLSGPITEDFRARVAIRGYEEDGYFYNSHKDRKQPAAEETAARLSFEWTPTDSLNLFLKAEKQEFSTNGRPIEITLDEAVPGGATYAQTLAAFGQPPMEANRDFQRQTDYEEVSDNEVQNITFNLDYDIGDHTLSLVSGWLDFNYTETCDCDNTASEIINLDLAEDYSQFSQEIRIASPTDGTLDWIAGVFYQNWDQTFGDALGITETNILTQVVHEGLADTGIQRDFTQTSDSLAAFGRVTWHMSDRFHLTLGGRFTEEEKQASKILQVYQPSTGNIIQEDPLAGWLYLSVFKLESEQATLHLNPPPVEPLKWSGHNVSHSRKEQKFNPLINLQVDITDDIMSYASFTTGFKAGGFDPRSNSVGNFAEKISTAPATEPEPYRNFEFEEESATAFEIGLKSTLADGRGEVNVSYYRTDYDDLQISQFDGAVGFNVGNAKKTLVQGIEVDGRWALMDTLRASYGVSLLDFEYKDFQNGNCYQGQTPDGIDINGDGNLDTCNYTGKRGVYTPKYTLNAGLDYHQPVFNDIELVGFIDVQHVAKQHVHVNLDPKGDIDSHTMLSARIGFESERWAVALLGKNLLDEYVISYSANAPLSSTLTKGGNTHYSVIRRPLTVALEGSLKF